jgi:hypothetical protein
MRRNESHGYSCSHCGWIGRQPSVTDASEARVDAYGAVVVDRQHLPVCPRCFSIAKPVSLVQLDETLRLAGALA